MEGERVVEAAPKHVEFAFLRPLSKGRLSSSTSTTPSDPKASGTGSEEGPDRIVRRQREEGSILGRRPLGERKAGDELSLRLFPLLPLDSGAPRAPSPRSPHLRARSAVPARLETAGRTEEKAEDSRPSSSPRLRRACSFRSRSYPFRRRRLLRIRPCLRLDYNERSGHSGL